MKWSDGQPLTAKDAAYTFNRIMKGSFEQTNYGNYVSNIKTVEAPDDATLVMTTKEPSPTMLRLAVPILPEHIWKDIDEKEVSTFDNEKNAVGSGPSARRAQHRPVRALTVNKDYWAGAPKIDEVVYRVFNNVPTPSSRPSRRARSTSPTARPAPFNSLKDTEGITVVPGDYSGFDELAFNTGAALDTGEPIGDGHPALKDKRVRQAIAHAVDKQALVDRVLGGYGTAATGVIPSLYQNLTFQPADGEAYNFDLAEANRLLDEAGYKDLTATMPRRCPTAAGRSSSGCSPTRSPTPPSSRTCHERWLRDIGIAEVKVEENRSTRPLRPGRVRHVRVGLRSSPDPDYQLSTFTCGSRSYKSGGDVLANLSDSFYCNPEYDKLYEQQKVTIDPAKRAEIVKQMQRLLYVDAVRGDLLLRRAPGLPQRPLRRLRSPARPGRRGAVPVRHLQLPQHRHLAGDRRGQRRRRRRAVIPIAVGVAVVGAAGVLALRRRSTQDEREQAAAGPMAAISTSGRSAPAPASAGSPPKCSGPCSAWPSCWCSTSSCSGAARRPGQEPHPQPPGPGRAGPGAQRELRAGALPHRAVHPCEGHTSGDLGISYKFRRPVSEVIERIWPTVLLLGLSTLLSTAIGLWIGIRGVEAQQRVRPDLAGGVAHPVRHARVLARHHAADRLSMGSGRSPGCSRPAGCPAPTPSWPARAGSPTWPGTCSCPAPPRPWRTPPQRAGDAFVAAGRAGRGLPDDGPGQGVAGRAGGPPPRRAQRPAAPPPR